MQVRLGSEDGGHEARQPASQPDGPGERCTSGEGNHAGEWDRKTIDRSQTERQTDRHRERRRRRQKSKLYPPQVFLPDNVREPVTLERDPTTKLCGNIEPLPLRPVILVYK